MARPPLRNKARPKLVKVRVSPEVDRALRKLAAAKDVPVSRLCYDALKALLAAQPAA